MSKRARYVGPYEEVVVHWPPGETAFSAQETWTVKNDGRLPDDAPAKLRDELLKGDDWVEYPQEESAKEDTKGSDK